MALIDELKQRRQELRQKMDELDIIANDLLDLNIAIDALEGPPVATLEQAPAQPVHPDELRDAPPAASEEEKETSDNQPCTCHPDDAPPVCQRLYAASQCQTAYYDKMQLVASAAPAEDFTLLDPAVLRDEPEIPKGFTRWEGGKCPVPFGFAYEWLERSGETYTDTHDEEGNLWRWLHNGGQDDLIAYRIISPEAEPGTQQGALIDTSNWQLEGNNFLAEQEAEAEPEPEGYAPVVDAEPEQSASEAINAFVEKLVADVSVSADTVAMQTYMDGDQVVVREVSAKELYAFPTDAPVVDAEPNPIDAAVEKGAITQDEADLLAAAKAELEEGSTARMFAQGMMADADRHQSDQRSIVEKIGGLFKREREDA